CRVWTFRMWTLVGVCSGAPRFQLKLLMCFHRGPLGGGDAIHASVAQRPVGHALMSAKNAVQLGAQAFDGPATLLVEEMCAELHRQAVQPIERMTQQQQLGLGIHMRALRTACIPG